MRGARLVIEPVPASTGVGGGLYAVKAGRPLVRTVMTSPTLNEASEYGADFVRDMRIDETNKGARFADVAHAITYVKHPADAERVRARLHAAGFEGFPHAMVAAPICRPDLLCETEALAVLKQLA